MEIEIAVRPARRLRSPWVYSLGALRRAERGALPLRFGWQGFADPPRERAGLCVAHVDRPLERQWEFVKHSAEVPAVPDSLPERGMADAVLSYPVPVILTPERPIFISASRHELKILTVAHLVLVYGECRYVHVVSFILVVPAEPATITT